MFHANFTTDYPPDSIEWSPVQSDLFACGTYFYQPENTTREGSIYLFRYHAENRTIEPIQHRLTHGILDLKWIQCSSDSVFLSTVSALGQLSLYSPNDLTKTIVCEDVTNDHTIALSQSWLHAVNNYVLISDQQGYLTICELDNSNGLRFSQSWLAHEYECWTCAWDKHDSNVVYSGADDTFLKIWDIRDCQQAVHVNRKHTMGICSIISDEKNPYQFLTGSFDEYLREWDRRQMNNPLKAMKLGGGVWKIRSHPYNAEILLCACMQNGFVIVDRKTQSILCHYRGHESLAYGCDWQWKESVNQLTELMDDCMNEPTNSDWSKIFADSFIASCSFYDKTVHVWKQQV